MLYFIGLGLGDEKDITMRGYEAVKSSDYIYLEAYTSVLSVGKERLEAFYGKEVIEADRNKVESEADEILDRAVDQVVSFLVVGDPFGATTHMDLMLRAKERGIRVEVIHNASIMNAIGATGLQLYSFGQTVSICLWTDSWQPDSYYYKIKENVDVGFHTLCLLDIKMKEQSIENLLKGKEIYEPPRFMTIHEALTQLLTIEERVEVGALTPQTICVGAARVGQPTQKIVAGTLEQIKDVDFGGPLHSLVICGEIQNFEQEWLDTILLSPEE